jgi:N-acetylglucosamine kinase-like BadF-type ATPase
LERARVASGRRQMRFRIDGIMREFNVADVDSFIAYVYRNVMKKKLIKQLLGLLER